MSQDFFIKARLAQQQVELRVSDDTTGREIKQMIGASLSLRPEEFRLISQGKVIGDEDTVHKAKLRPGFVVQAVKLHSELAVVEPSEPSSPSVDPLQHLQALLNSLPPSVLFDSSSRTRPRRIVPLHFKLEAVRQNLMTVESLLETRAKPWRWTHEDCLFIYRLRSLQPGQWVDVQDTVEAWLEAQVLDVLNVSDTAMALIHYTEWPEEWDEWLEVESPRIQPFRTYTTQGNDSPVQSPYPVSMSDDLFRTQSSLFDPAEYISKASHLLAEVLPLLVSYLDKSNSYAQVPDSESEAESQESDDGLSRKLIEKSKEAQQLGIILDRLGRALSDLSLLVESECAEGQERLEVMASLNDPRLVDQDSEIRIHAIFAPRPSH